MLRYHRSTKIPNNDKLKGINEDGFSKTLIVSNKIKNKDEKRKNILLLIFNMTNYSLVISFLVSLLIICASMTLIPIENSINPFLILTTLSSKGFSR